MGLILFLNEAFSWFNGNMKIGVFDSGLGGLFTMSAIVKKLPEYDYVYLGDTKRLPYGSRSQEMIYEFLKEGVDFLFSKNCALIIVACNTASAEALRKLQQEYLPKKYPIHEIDKKVLGMIVPIVEECAQYKSVGLIGTSATIASGAYQKEFIKRNHTTKVIGLPTPLLVPIIENNEKELLMPTIQKYLTYFKNKKIEALILGCTHYAIIKKEVASLMPKNIKIISQNDIIPNKTKEYLKRHPEIETILSKNKSQEFFVTDTTQAFQKTAKKWFGEEVNLIEIAIEK